MEPRAGGLEELVTIVRTEYREMPGLHLTKSQFSRLWCLDAATCDALLGRLEEAHFLRRTEHDAYVRTDVFG